MGSLTLSMIVKNEEQYLHDCLQSVKGAVDEIVIVDTGSDDASVKIAEAHGAKVFYRPWDNNFSAARNYALSKSSGDWVLYLDADERITPESIEILNRIKNTPAIEGKLCTLISKDERGGRPALMQYVRLFPNDSKIRFKNRVHEQILEALSENSYKISACDVEIIHIGYDIEVSKLKEKGRRNLDLLLLDYKEEPTGYTAFQLGQTYALLTEKKEAVVYFAKALEDPYLAYFYKAHSHRFLSAYHLELDDLQSAYFHILKALEAAPTQPLVNLIASKLCFKANETEKAVDFAKKAYELNTNLMSGKVKSEFDIMVSPSELAYYLLELAISYSNPELFNFFVEKVNADRNIKKEEFQTELHFIQLLINQRPLTDEEMAIGVNLITKSKISAYLNLIKNVREVSQRAKLLSLMYTKFSAVPDVINAYALLIESLGEYFEAEELFNKSHQADPNYPVTLFLLISNSLFRNRMDQVDNLIKEGYSRFGDIEAVVQRLKIIEEKVNSLTSFS